MTVKLVNGTAVSVQTDGTLVTVRTNGSTKVQSSASAAIKDLKAGEAVTVQGPADTDGTVTATAVTATAK